LSLCGFSPLSSNYGNNVGNTQITEDVRRTHKFMLSGIE
jgi:hypothetical protein